MDRCQYCGTVEIGDNIESFHELVCPNNKLSFEEWNERKKERIKNIKYLFDTILNIAECDKKVKNMSYKELGDYILHSQFYGKLKMGTMDEAVLSRVIDILYDLSEKKASDKPSKEEN